MGVNYVDYFCIKLDENHSHHNNLTKIIDIVERPLKRHNQQIRGYWELHYMLPFSDLSHQNIKDTDNA